jgi:hypothetical protein
LAPHDLLAGLGILVGLVGIVVVVFPGLLVILGSVALWALVEQSVAGWVALSLAIAIAVTASVLKYLHPGRKLKEIGIPTAHLLAALGVGVIGFFMIPVVGAFIGFVATIYLLQRIGGDGDRARSSALATLGAIALSIGIELVGGFLMAAVWVTAVIFG